jgi:hypothetical protein
VAEQQQAPSSNPEESLEWVVSVADSDEEEEAAPPEEGSWEHWEEVTRFLHCSPCVACVAAD